MAEGPEGATAVEERPAHSTRRGTTPAEDARVRRLRFVDRLVAVFITLGGVGIILAVLGIFFFVFKEAAPLFFGAAAAEEGTVRAAAAAGDAKTTLGRPLALGEDAYRENAFVLGDAGAIHVIDLARGTVRAAVPLAGLGGARVTCGVAAQAAPVLAAGTSDGRVLVAGLAIRPVYEEGRRTGQTVEVAWQAEFPLREDGGPLQAIAVAADDEQVVVAGMHAGGGGAKAFLGVGQRTIEGTRARTSDSTAALGRKTASALALDETGETLVVGFTDGSVDRFTLDREEADQAESILAGDAAVTALGFAFGSRTLLVGDARGRVSGWHGMRTAGVGARTLSRAREFDRMNAPIAGFAASRRNKAFLVRDAEGRVRLDHVTTERTIALLPGEGAVAMALSPKFDGALLADEDGTLRRVAVDASHPDVSLAVLFTPTLYEDYAAPEHQWQSTGGTDDYEPKLSLVPLIVGSLKGVLYALFFSAPLAILAALYTSQFASQRVRSLVKPAIELMGALPSVVLGFLAGLWFAPRMDANLAASLDLLVLVPLFIGFAVLAHRLLPQTLRQRLSTGRELVFLLPFLGAAVGFAFAVGSPVEDALFGGDLRRWLTQTMDVAYDPRNCIVVGLALGFAVIPIVFTVAEDAMGNVPRSLRAASEALGASRWQTAWRLVLPAASPGIFAGLMLGFGRAIGETMIVVMATGNTPIMDLSIFNGMRTISASIATEMPEAPVGSSLYRVLFLAGALLFVFTFLINTLAEVVGARLRMKFARW